jgi:hypothetical protein
MEPEPIKGTELGEDLAKLREQHPQTAFTMGPYKYEFYSSGGPVAIRGLARLEIIICKTI